MQSVVLCSSSVWSGSHDTRRGTWKDPASEARSRRRAKTEAYRGSCAPARDGECA